MDAFITLLLTVAAEAMKAKGDPRGARRVEAILKGRTKLSEVEADLYRRAFRRLGL